MLIFLKFHFYSQNIEVKHIKIFLKEITEKPEICLNKLLKCYIITLQSLI